MWTPDQKKDIQMAYKNMKRHQYGVIWTCHQGNANYNNEIPLHTYQKQPKSKLLAMPNAGYGVRGIHSFFCCCCWNAKNNSVASYISKNTLTM